MAAFQLTGGHTTAVLCVDVDKQSGMIASGSEEGDLCLWSAAGALIHTYSCTDTDTDCTSVLFAKEKNNTLYAAFGSKVLVFDTSSPEDPIFTFQR